MPPLNYPKPSYRKLRGYAFDPSFSSTLNKRQNNEVIYKVRWEPLSPGPRGEYIEVVDYDPTKQCHYAAISLDDPYVLADHGMSLSEGDPRFHQQQVYAVVMSVINQFEKALGRKIIWSRISDNSQSVDGSRNAYIHEFIPRLRIYPHAMRQQNAYYSPEKYALLFGYFKACNNWDGNNVPGSTIFTCLSPDIVAHETTHAILDSIHPYLTRDTNPDMLAFHEGFADIIALLQRFTFRSVVEDQIRNSRGDLLSPENMLGDLAIQFGQAVSSNRRALRSFLVEKDEAGKWRSVKPDPTKFHTVVEPHSRGGLLVAAVFDAFTRLYKYRVADLIRLATDGTGILEQGEIDPDLVRRLANEACEIASSLMLVCIRALDYCPPADLTFGDYLRAIVTADLEHNPDDEQGLRFAMMESFRSWGIIPMDVNTFSVEALSWKSPSEVHNGSPQLGSLVDTIKYSFDPSSEGTKNNRIHEVLGSVERILREEDRGVIFNESQKLAAFIHDLFDPNSGMLRDGAEELLGMNFKGIEYQYTELDGDGNAKSGTLKSEPRPVFQVYKCRPMITPGVNCGNTSKVMLIMLLQKVYVDLTGSRYEGLFPNNKYAFRGGASLVIDMTNYEIKYIILKSVTSTDRLIKQLDYAEEALSDADHCALLMQDEEPFAALHIH